MKIVTILGARPQFIKAAAVSRALQNTTPRIKEIIVHTGQHFDHNMSDIFFEEMNIPLPDYNLEISSLSHGAMTGRMLEKIEEVLLKEKPDLLLVYGDTNSTLAGALAASKLHIPVAHIEAGLRSFNMQMPEEINRVLTDRISAYLFCPTQVAVDNLIKEGYDKLDCKIIKTGDVMQDAALYHAKQAKKPAHLDEILVNGEFALATIHRAENTDDPIKLKILVDALNEIHKHEMPVVFPLHPRTLNKLKQHQLTLKCHAMDPVSYLEMIYLLQNAHIVLTDSGGLQKEAYYFAKPCVTLRGETEWLELITSGANQLAPLTQEGIINAFELMKNKKIDTRSNLYGGGNASEEIVSIIERDIK